jgi:O-succinylbenzoate synthase
LPTLPYACGLGSGALLEADVVAEPLLPVDGELPVVRPEADPAALAAATADAAAADRWRQRLDRVADLADR